MLIRPDVFKYAPAHRGCYCIPADTTYEKKVEEQLKLIRPESSWETIISPLIATFVDDKFYNMNEILEYAKTLSPPRETNDQDSRSRRRYEYTRYVLVKIEHDFGRSGFRSMSFIGVASLNNGKNK